MVRLGGEFSDQEKCFLSNSAHGEPPARAAWLAWHDYRPVPAAFLQLPINRAHLATPKRSVEDGHLGLKIGRGLGQLMSPLAPIMIYTGVQLSRQVCPFFVQCPIFRAHHLGMRFDKRLDGFFPFGCCGRLRHSYFLNSLIAAMA
jgi:hypothetical protein